MDKDNSAARRTFPHADPSPSPARADGPVELRLVVTAAAVCATLAAAVFGYQIAGRGTLWSLGGISLSLSMLWYAALRPGLGAETRVKAALCAQYLATIISVTVLGICTEAMLLLVGFVSLTALRWGRTRARLAFALAALTVLAMPWLSGFAMEGSQALSSLTHALNWTRVSLLGSGVIVLVAGCAVSSAGELSQSWATRFRLAEGLRAETEQRKQALDQLAEAQERLSHAHKLEAVGRLAGGIAHDFNNTLTVILSYGELLRARLGNDPRLAELTDHIVHAAQQGGDLTQQLLTFSRRQVDKPRSIEVGHMLTQTERTLSRLVPKDVRVHREETSEPLFVTVEPTQLQQAVLNLALNARDAMPQGGDLYLETRREQIDDPTLPLLPGQYVAIRVRDTGVGMDEATRRRIFEPFFTTKEPGRGTGLGLSNVLETVQAASGHVTVSSSPGEGSLLTLYLPLTDPAVTGIESSRPPKRPAMRGRLLVVDDEPKIRQVIGTLLSEEGFEVREAENCASALEIMQSESIDLLCADVVLPDSSGIELIDAARALNPRLPVVVCSAYGVGKELSQRLADGEIAFLGKPFSGERLREVVFRALSTEKLSQVSAGAPISHAG